MDNAFDIRNSISAERAGRAHCPLIALFIPLIVAVLLCAAGCSKSDGRAGPAPKCNIDSEKGQ